MTERQKSPSKRPNDGLSTQTRSRIPLGQSLRRMAELVLHERPKEKRPPKYKRGIGNCHAAKRGFSEEQVREIRAKYKAGTWPSVLAAEYKCSKAAIKQIVNGVTYVWVTA